MTEVPLISVVVPAYEPGPYLAETLASIAAQSYRPVEIIVVDDGSPTPIRIAPAGGIPLRLIRQPNRGVSAARNTGLAAAHGEWLVFLDADDLWTADALRCLAAAMSASPDCAAAHGRTQAFRRAEAGALELIRAPFHGFNLGSLLFARAAVAKIGGFDESMRFSEDFDFLIRLKESGARRHQIDDLVMLYRRGHGSTTEKAKLDLDWRPNVRNWATVLAANLARRRGSSGA